VDDTYRALTPASGAAARRASKRIPGGVTSNVKFFPPYPLFMSRARGSRIVDLDGREYLDFCLAFGPLIAGHGHPRIQRAILDEMERAGTVILGAPSALEAEYAERLASVIPSADMVRFTNSGTEATMHALRIARGATSRRRIIKFEGHYHGVHDAVLLNLDRPGPAAPSSDGVAHPEDTVVLPFNDPEAFRRAIETEPDIAAVILEPVARGAIPADSDFLNLVRDLTARRDIVLVFDEVVSWPRVGLSGAQGLYGVTPDLTALGKAIGGGLPMGAVAGKRGLMEIVAPRGARDEVHPFDQAYVFHGGTYNGTPAALAAGLALVDLLQEDGNLTRLLTTGEECRQRLRDLLSRRGRPAQVIGVGAAFDFYFTEESIRSSREIWRSDLETRRAVDYRLLEEGIYNAPVHRFHLSLAHSADDLDRALDAIERAIETLEGG
jgi:glutamate-1-semialdehyde 2,1-aminomutase